MSHADLSHAVRSSLASALERDERVVLLGETSGRGGGLWGASAGLLASFGPERVRDLPVSDRAMVGLAAGMAFGGLKPVVELSSTHRLTAVLEPLQHAAQNAGFEPTLVLRVPYGTDAGPVVDQPIGTLLDHGARVLCARSPEAAQVLLDDALAHGGPTVLLEPRHLGANDTGAPAAANRVDELRAGDHLTLVSWGAQLGTALHAAEQLAAEGLSTQVLDLVSLAPLDAQGLGEQLRRTGRLVVLHPNDLAAADRIVRTVVEQAFLYLEAPPARATTLDQVLTAARHAATW